MTNLSGSIDTTDNLALLRRMTAFGHELAGILRRASVIDLFLRHVRDALTPAEIALSLFHHDADTPDPLYTWPPGGPIGARCSR